MIWIWSSQKITYSSFYKKYYYLIINTSVRKNKSSQPIQLEAIMFRNSSKTQENKVFKIRIVCCLDRNLFKQEQNFLRLNLLDIDSLFLFNIKLSIIINAYVRIYIYSITIILLVIFLLKYFGSFTYFLKIWLRFNCYIFFLIPCLISYQFVCILFFY